MDGSGGWQDRGGLHQATPHQLCGRMCVGVRQCQCRLGAAQRGSLSPPLAWQAAHSRPRRDSAQPPARLPLGTDMAGLGLCTPGAVPAWHGTASQGTPSQGTPRHRSGTAEPGCSGKGTLPAAMAERSQCGAHRGRVGAAVRAGAHPWTAVWGEHPRHGSSPAQVPH